MGEKSHRAQNSLIGLLTGRIVGNLEVMLQVLLNSAYLRSWCYSEVTIFPADK